MSYKVDVRQIFQALLVSGITTLGVMYGTQKGIMVEVSAIRDDVAEIKQSVKDEVAEVKQSIKEIRRDFYIPKR